MRRVLKCPACGMSFCASVPYGLEGVCWKDPKLRLMEANYKTAQSLGGGAMDVVAGALPNMKALVESSLEACQLAESRPSKMTQDEFIQLLSAFSATLSLSCAALLSFF